MKYLNELKNMKKTYICPEMDVIELKNQQALLTASAGFGDPMSGDNAAAPEFDDELGVFGDLGLIGF